MNLLALGRLMAACAALATAGCLEHGVFRCQTNHDCGPNGQCESTGVCSFVDEGCLSHRRYGTHAPDGLSGRCVDHQCPANRVVALRAGSAHACLVKQNGAVACWGSGRSGQLGDGATISRSTVVDVSGLGVARDIALGDRHTCALLADRTVWCWGANESGQLGDGDTSAAPGPTPRRAGDLGDIVAVAAGGGFTCAASDAGQVYCWGRNTDGELGAALDDPSPSPTPVALADLPLARRLTARDRHACALTDDSRVFCWGSNSQGELGDGSQTSRRAPTEVSTLGGQGITALAAGAAHTCAVGAGRLWCWGANQAGQLGTGNDDPLSLPALVPLTAVRDVAAGGHHTCASDADGTAWCWGANSAGQLGEGTSSNISVPVPVTGLADSAGVTAGDSFSCARRRDGTVWCWGDDRLGQLGIGTDIERLAPVRVSLDRALAITAGTAHTCALRPAADGAATTVCWGDNQAGQVGDGTRLDRPSPVSLKISLNARDVVAGAQHGCLRGGDGSVWCWGRGGAGQLGTTALIDVAIPVNVASLGGISAIAAGGAHSCALRDTALSCWGGNDDGQLGDGTNRGRSMPAVVGGAGEIVQVAAGGAHTCARQVGGTVMCWGRGLEGQLGQNAFDSSNAPVAVVNLAGEPGARLVDVKKVAAGSRHTCAALADGRVACWGDGSSGQLGWKSMVSAADRRQIPVAVAGLDATAVDIAVGNAHTCARTTPDGNPDTPGSVYCWGANDAGQLGNGGRDTWPQAMNAVPIAGVVAIAAGGAHTCALTSDQSTYCWGSNSSGQLGDGANLQYPTAQPTHVTCP